MVQINRDELVKRFIAYAKIDTQSDPTSKTAPSTDKQLNLSRLLKEQLIEMGLQAELDEYGVVTATLPSNSDKENLPVIAFFAHVDTAPDCSGENVKPIIHKNYQGQDIILPDDPTQILSVETSPYLKNHIGKDIITASGNTLLGSDDKSGVAIIMTAIDTLIQNPTIKHGEIKVVFNPDEEIGHGTDNINIEKLGAHFAYTLDGGELGELENETFSADQNIVTITGVSTHPGYAKGKMLHSTKVAAAVIDATSIEGWSPETTEGREGFVHITDIQGGLEETKLTYIVRDFTTKGLEVSHARLEEITRQTIQDNFSKATVSFERKKQYRNMFDVIQNYPQCVTFAEEAIQRTGIAPVRSLIRGGTDGSRLSEKGLPCPNIFTGMQNIHSRTEWVGVEDMVKAVETIIHLAAIWEEKG
jgi:tripeptide aminopeptidase